MRTDELTPAERAWAVETLKTAGHEAGEILKDVAGLTQAIVRAQGAIAEALSNPPEDADKDQLDAAGYAASAQLVRLHKHFAVMAHLWPECAREWGGRREA